MGPRIREDKGRGSGATRFFTPLRYVQNDMWGSGLWTEWYVWEGEKMGPRIREDTEGRAPLFLLRTEGRLNLAASVGERDWGDAGFLPLQEQG